MGSVLYMARAHTKIILESGGFETEITFQSSPAQPLQQTVTITGLAIKHHLDIDTDGLPIRSQHAHVTVSEESLTDKGYTTRNAKGQAYLKDNLVSFADSTGVVKTYIVTDQLPDTTLGCIPLILGNYNKPT